MHSPFPGMDPYIEAFRFWEDFHDKLVGEIERHISPRLPHRYIARLRERTYVGYLNIDEFQAERRGLIPDVSVEKSGTWDEHKEAGTRSIVPNSDAGVMVMHGLIETDYREIYLEIRELDPERRLVTSIEVLSPTNKRYGSTGWHEYERKRRIFLEGHANLVELDLLRQGRRRPMQEPWPESPYHLLVLRKESAPRFSVWPAFFDRPIPEIPIPLAAPDPDIRLNLQPLIDAIYTRSRYYLDIDYQKPLRPPLAPEEKAWLHERLKALNSNP